MSIPNDVVFVVIRWLNGIVALGNVSANVFDIIVDEYHDW